MSKKDDQIARLQAELGKAEARAADAEARVARLEKERDKERARREELEAFLLTIPEIADCACQSIDLLNAMKQDIPEVERAAYVHMLQSLNDGFSTLAKDRLIQRLLKKGSEKIGKRKDKKQPDVEEALTNARNKFDKTKRDLKRRGAELQKAMEAVAEAAKTKKTESSANPLAQAASAIAKTPDPVTQEFPRRPSVGRQVPEEKNTAKAESVNCSEPPKVCPYCGGTQGIFSGRIHADPLRTVSDFCTKAADFVARVTQHCYCPSCQKAFYSSTGDDLPSLPGRQMGQRLMAECSEKYCLGIPLEKIEHWFFPERSRLGKATLGNNLHKWALDTLEPLLDSLTSVMAGQHTLLMDETPFSVLQSKGQGICEPPSEDDQRQKDYVAVQCSTFFERHRCFRYIYLGSRSAEKIYEALSDVHPQVLVTDGYGPYATYCQGDDRPVAQNCCAHLRREIIDALAIPALNKHLFDENPAEAVKKAKALFDNGSPAFFLCMVLEAFSKIYGNEASLIREEGETDESFQQRIRESRNKYARPLMDHIDTIMCGLAEKLTRKTPAGSYESLDKTRQVGSAVVYYMNRRESFRVFLDDPRVPPDSNAVEQSVRPVVVLRKACDFKQSQEHMKSLCIMMSLYRTAMENGITDFKQWILDYSHDFFIYRANKTLTNRLKNSATIAAALDPKLMAFDSDAGKGYDFTRYYPWNYKK